LTAHELAEHFDQQLDTEEEAKDMQSFLRSHREEQKAPTRYGRRQVPTRGTFNLHQDRTMTLTDLITILSMTGMPSGGHV